MRQPISFNSRWYALVLLSATYMCHSIDRQVMAVVVEPIKREFLLSDTSIGILTGVAYTTAFAIASIPIGWLIDRTNRRNLLSLLLIIWSGLTALGALAGGYASFLLIRIGVGAAEAGGQPTCLSLISDLFKARERSSAVGYFYISTAAGISISFLLGGIIAASYGWRAALLIAGVPGILVAVLLLGTIGEPARQRDEQSGHPNDTGQPIPLLEVARHVLATKPLLNVATAITLTSFTVTANWIWLSSFLIRVHQFELKQVGVIGAFAAFAQAAGAAVVGRTGERVARSDFSRLALVPAISTALAGLLGIGMAYAPSDGMALLFLMAVSFMLGGYLGPTYGIALSIVPSGMRGIIAAGLQITINLLGSGLGPLVTGMLSDAVGGAASLQPALALTMSVNFVASAFYLLTYRSLASRRPKLAKAYHGA